MPILNTFYLQSMLFEHFPPQSRKAILQLNFLLTKAQKAAAKVDRALNADRKRWAATLREARAESAEDFFRPLMNEVRAKARLKAARGKRRMQ